MTGVTDKGAGDDDFLVLGVAAWIRRVGGRALEVTVVNEGFRSGGCDTGRSNGICSSSVVRPHPFRQYKRPLDISPTPCFTERLSGDGCAKSEDGVSERESVAGKYFAPEPCANEAVRGSADVDLSQTIPACRVPRPEGVPGVSYPNVEDIACGVVGESDGYRAARAAGVCRNRIKYNCVSHMP